MCEDLENVEGLHHMFEIVKTLFLLDKNFLYDTMFSESNIMDILGCLEYDPTKKDPQRYRKFLKENVHFREVIPINNAELLAKIHQTYQVQYIMDIVLPTPTVFEENMLPSLNSFLIFSKFEIVSMVQVSFKHLYFFGVGLYPPSACIVKINSKISSRLIDQYEITIQCVSKKGGQF